jgi:hypothetical protein
MLAQCGTAPILSLSAQVHQETVKNMGAYSGKWAGDSRSVGQSRSEAAQVVFYISCAWPWMPTTE